MSMIYTSPSFLIPHAAYARELTDSPCSAERTHITTNTYKISGASDFHAFRILSPQLHFTPEYMAGVLINLHVYASRNCMWGPLARAQSLLKDVIRAHNVSVPAMHYVEIPGLCFSRRLRLRRRRRPPGRNPDAAASTSASAAVAATARAAVLLRFLLPYSIVDATEVRH
jgi:hypothetical protein